MRRRKSSVPKSNLSREDRVLWKRVADTTTPVSRQRGQFLKDEMNRLMEQTSSPVSKNLPRLSSPMAPQKSLPIKPELINRQHHTSHPIEERIAKKLARGRLPIDSRIDLHGMTQDRARFALLDFLQMAQRADHRIVLVITGKGNEGRGILRQAVPDWLHLPVFNSLVNGFRISHASHGGEGALYVRLRKLQQRINKGGDYL